MARPPHCLGCRDRGVEGGSQASGEGELLVCVCMYLPAFVCVCKWCVRACVYTFGEGSGRKGGRGCQGVRRS